MAGVFGTVNVLGIQWLDITIVPIFMKGLMAYAQFGTSSFYRIDTVRIASWHYFFHNMLTNQFICIVPYQIWILLYGLFLYIAIIVFTFRGSSCCSLKEES